MNKLNYKSNAMRIRSKNTNWTARPCANRLLAEVTLACALATSTTHAAVRYQVLKSFMGANGSQPESSLVEGSDGALYGTTRFGGSNNAGSVFRLSKDGTDYRILHQFGATNDGASPVGGVIQATDGTFYGATAGGGSNGVGTIFELESDGGSYAILHHFSPGNGAYPSAGLIEGNNGALYGSLNPWTSDGTVFRINKDGTDFVRASELAGSYAALVQGSDGALYGTHPIFGLRAAVCGEYGGDIFKIGRAFEELRFLRGFYTCEWELEPRGIIEGSDGALYGTIAYRAGVDLAFKMNKDGTGYSIISQILGSSSLAAALAEGRDGALYGTTVAGGTNLIGGSNDVGTVFMLNKDGSCYRILHRFGGHPHDGRYPSAGVIHGSDGASYGTTSAGGEFGFGTVFKLWPPPRLLPPVFSNGVVTLRIMDGPGLTNELQRATALDGNWQTLTNLGVPPGGVAEFTDPAPPMPGAFYRSIGR